MSVIESILDLATDTLTIRRRQEGRHDDDGIWQPGTASELKIIACVQPATGMQRVVGGRDMRSDEQGQVTNDVRVVYTESLLHTRGEDFEPDQVINFEGGTWTMIRVEKWAGPDGPEDVYYRALMTRETRGSG